MEEVWWRKKKSSYIAKSEVDEKRYNEELEQWKTTQEQLKKSKPSPKTNKGKGKRSKKKGGDEDEDEEEEQD